MLTKFETRSSRVKGLAFHPKRPWILASLHTGAIQLWDYRMGTLIDRFEEHDAGPVRGVDFHSTQPLFVSGGDDYKIKVWNHKLRRCLFTLVGHMDYIRTVQFHKEQPWILSASDDQTLRIWNWQGRSCIAVLAGHNHYVMSAAFHPKDDLVVSASLDNTLRVWDISGLKKQKSSNSEILNVNINQELFGGTDVLVKFILEGHEKGVNWAAFHPTHPLIVSGADDRSIRIWKIDDSRGFEIEQLRGHVNNVSCVTYFKDYVVSTGEDRTIRVWEVKQRSAIHTFRRDNDRFWVVAVHPERNLIAAGHDSGLIVFKLERERPAHTLEGPNKLLWVKDRQLKTYDFDSHKEDVILQLRRSVSPSPHMSYRGSERLALFFYEQDGGTYELYTLARSGTNPDEVKRGYYLSATFFSRNKFVVLDKTKQLVVRNASNDVVRVSDPLGQIDMLFPAGPGQVLARFDDRISLVDMQNKKIVGECTAAKVKYVVWSPDNTRVALLSKHAIVVANRKLKHICSVHENSRVKSAAFDDNNVLIYTTQSHLKYCLPSCNGDTGILKTMLDTVYVVKVRDTEVWFIDREGKVDKLEMDPTEFRFKQALAQKNFPLVVSIMQKTPIRGQALVAYLQQRGFPDVAMQFVKDNRIRFNLAIECGDLAVAEETAKELKDPDCWRILARVALKFGRVQMAEQAYLQTGDYDKLCFLYLVTGNRDRLSAVLQDTSKKIDVMTRFEYALYLGDTELRVKILEDAGQYALAAQLAASLGNEEKATQLREQVVSSLAQQISSAKGEEAETAQATKETLTEQFSGLVEEQPKYPLLEVPAATSFLENWPTEPMAESLIQSFIKHGASRFTAEDSAAPTWGDDDDFLDQPDDDVAREKPTKGEWETDDLFPEEDAGEQKGPGGWIEGDIEFSDDETDATGPSAPSAAGNVVFPTSHPSLARKWVEHSNLAVDHVAAGDFAYAKTTLEKQCAIYEFGPLKPYLMSIYAAATGTMSGISTLPAFVARLNRTADKPGISRSGRRVPLPALAYTLVSVEEKLKAAYKAFADGKFVEASELFKQILYTIPFVVVADKKASGDLQELLTIAREYVAALRLELTRRREAEAGSPDPKRQLELGAYFTHAHLQPQHNALTLNAAMAAAYRAKNFKTASGFARRLLDTNPAPKTGQQARKVIQLSDENQNRNTVTLDYDDSIPFVVCGSSLKPIVRGQDKVACGYCNQPYLAEHNNSICMICDIGKVGRQGTGMQNTY